METIAWIGFSQSIFAAILIFSKIKKELHDKILATWLIICAIEFLFLAYSLKVDRFFLTTPFLIFNPILYFYIKSLVNKSFKVNWTVLLHVLPAAFFFLFSVILNIEISLNSYFERLQFGWYSYLFAIALLTSFFIYSSLGVIEVHRYRMNLKNMVSTIDTRKNLTWLLSLLIYYILYFIIIVVLGAINVFTNMVTYAIIVSYANLLFMVYVFGFYGLQQKAVFFFKSNGEKAEPYKKSSLNESSILSIKKAIDDLFEKKKIFLESELTIQMVADQINVSRHTLTEFLNKEVGKNFYQFVNEYRVREVKNKLSLKENDLLSIEAIGYDCGFSSKSTFFAVFKSFTGITPMQYKQSR